MNKKIIATITGLLTATALAGYLLTAYQLPPHVPATGRLLSSNVMLLETSGTAQEYKLYDLRATTYSAVWDCASYAIIMANVENSQSHAIRIGQASKGGCKPNHVIVIYSKINNAILENYPPSTSNGWGSCIKAELGTSDIEIRYNEITNCYGEGIDTAETIGAVIVGNILKNCWSYCIYIDNSVNVIVQDNTASCPDASFYRDGGPAVSFGVGDENLSKWGGGGVSIAANITIENNTSYGCKAAKYWGSQYTNGGVDGLSIINNTFYDTSTRVYASSQPRNKNIVLTGNVYLASGQTPIPSATPTKTKTVTPSPTTIKTNTPAACVPGLYSVAKDVQLNVYPKSLNMREDHTTGSRSIGNLYADPGIRHHISWIWTDCTNYWGGIDQYHWFALRLNGVYFSDWRP